MIMMIMIVFIVTCMYMYIYIKRERERERERDIDDLRGDLRARLQHAGREDPPQEGPAHTNFPTLGLNVSINSIMYVLRITNTYINIDIILIQLPLVLCMPLILLRHAWREDPPLEGPEESC